MWDQRTTFRFVRRCRPLGLEFSSRPDRVEKGVDEKTARAIYCLLEKEIELHYEETLSQSVGSVFGVVADWALLLKLLGSGDERSVVYGGATHTYRQKEMLIGHGWRVVSESRGRVHRETPQAVFLPDGLPWI